MAEFQSKTIVLELLEHGFGRGDRTVFERLVSENYVQHSSFVRTGRKGLLELLDSLQNIEGNEFRLVRILEDSPLVLLHCEWNAAGNRQALFDLFRLDNGWLVEHWDVLQGQAATTPHGRGMLDGPTAVVDGERTVANKALVENFVRSVLLERRLERLADFFDDDRYIQHSPDQPDGAGAIREQVSAGGDRAGVRYQTLHRVVGEGNFVLTQSEGTREGVRSAFYDLFRIERSKLVEHWDVVQAIPPMLPHDNGFF